MNILLRIVFIFIFFLIPLNELNARELYVSKNVDYADQLIENGATNTAYFILKKELKNKSYSILDKYKITKLISRCFLKELDFTHYDIFNRKAFEYMKDQGEIYKAQYYIERVYFFHHLTWSDSVVYYADLAHKIFYANKKDWSKIEVPFFFQIYAIKSLYINDYANKFSDNYFKTPLRWVKIFQYYDSALFYSKRYPYRQKSDLALLHRGIGNRHLDLVSGYNYPKDSKINDLSKLNRYCYFKSKKSYTKANSLLDKNNITERISNYSLLALLEMCVGLNDNANKYFDNMHSIYKRNKDVFIPSPVYLSGMTYERMNDFNHKFNINKTKKTIEILEGFVPKWLSHINSLKTYSYDIYSYSPFYQLFCQYSRLYFHTHNTYFAKKAIVNLINEKLHFKKLNKRSNFEYFRRQSSFYEMERLKIDDSLVTIIKKSKQSGPFDINDLNRLMKCLKFEETILLSYKSNDFLQNYKVIITNKKVSYVKSKNNINFSLLDFENTNFQKYKIEAFKAYYTTFFNIIKFKKNIKKIFVLYDDDFPYEKLVTRLKGNSYSDLKYLINNVEFIKLYDFEDYFLKPILTSKLKVSKILLSDSTQLNLPFMCNFRPQIHKNYYKQFILKSDIKSYLKNNNVLHFVGHGNNSFVDSNGLNHHNQLIYHYFNKKKVSEKLDLNMKINSPLIILNNCYSGQRVAYNYIFDKGIYLELMKNNAKNVVAASDKIDDYVSSQIMKNFYDNLKFGVPIGEALVKAKRKFLRENKNGYSNPLYWSPFFVISSRKLIFK